MKQSFKQAVLHRRTHYSITNASLVSDAQIEDILKFAVKNVPSAFNSQSTRVVLLLGEGHKRLWEIVMDALRAVVPEANFGATRTKVDFFAAGYGTVLFFEEQNVVHSLESSFPLYAANFQSWSVQTSAMHQFTVWTMLEDVGFGASLQHYNELIDTAVIKEWSLPNTWKLIAQMPFGVPSAEPAEKTFEPLDARVLVIR